ncbi:MAG: hypothetical protein GXO66_03355 [Euryarchaeota archaeon]|nr:hypothetical protein [Euryarchaeota archaeon]
MTKLRLSAAAGLLVWLSLFLPWWYISGLGPKIGISPVFLLKLALVEDTAAGIIELSEGFSGLILLSFLLAGAGGAVGVFRSRIRSRALVFVAGMFLLSVLNLLTYAFIYLKVEGSVLCLTPSIYGAPLGWGLEYGFAVAALSGVIIILGAIYDL